MLEKAVGPLAMMSTAGAALKQLDQQAPVLAFRATGSAATGRIYASTWLRSGIAALRQLCRNP